jgi:diguanylate cyclase (GGDEF)-like protein/PAS domain S-box-containing protein
MDPPIPAQGDAQRDASAAAHGVRPAPGARDGPLLTDDRFRSMADNVPGMVFRFVMSPEGKLSVPYASAGCRDVYGIDAEDLMSDPGRGARTVHPDDVQGRSASIAHSAAQLTRWDWRGRHVMPDQTIKHVHGTSTPVRGADGSVVWDGIVTDETAMVEAGAREAELVQRFQDAFEHAPIGMAVVSLDGRYLQVNQAFCQIVGYDRDRLEATAFPELTHPDDVAASQEGLRRLLAGETPVYQAEKRYLHGAGHTVWVTVSATVVRDANGAPDHLLSQVLDITERKRFEAHLQHMADHDALTGMVNRRRFQVDLEAHLAQWGPTGAAGALMVLDIDDLKTINDTLGHAAGDQLLVSVAAVLRTQLRPTDVLARIGGDEFAILLRDGDRQQSAAVADRLLAAIREQAGVRSAARLPPVTVSLGALTFDGRPPRSYEEAMVDADLAMYAAKAAGGDRCVGTVSGAAAALPPLTVRTEPRRRATDEHEPLAQAALDALPAHVAVLDAAGEIIMANRAWRDFAAANGMAAPEQAQNYLAACDAAAGEATADRAASGLRAIIAGRRRTFSLEYPCHSAAGQRWFVLRAARYDGPGRARVVVAHDDVTARVEAEAVVATQAALLDEVDVAVVATDTDGRVTHWNRGAERLYGWTLDEAIGHVGRELLAPDVATFSDQVDPALREAGHWAGEALFRRKDGAVLTAYLRNRLLRDAEGRTVGRIGVSVDLSDRLAAERELRSARDYMRAVANNIGEGLFTLDVEGRVIYMNETAERMLGWTLEALQGRVMHDITHFRRADGTACSSDDCPIDRARRVGERQRVEDDIFIQRDGRELAVAYTAAPLHTDDGLEGCVVVFGDISQRKEKEEALRREAEKLAWITRIREALAEDRFVLYAQPIVDLGTGQIVQRELLLRLREPSGEIVGPREYLDIAEQYGLIGDIDRWVIGQAAEIAAAGCPVELNISGRSIGDPSILRHIEDCLERTGADPMSMVFEVTETALAEDHGAALAFAQRLHALGCKLALDDFGTGYSGFTYLKQLPVDYLKIDIEFVRDLASNAGSRHVVEAVVALARGFELQTVAEGVEDAETLTLLGTLGVDFAQGYYIARPAPTERWCRASTDDVAHDLTAPTVARIR